MKSAKPGPLFATAHAVRKEAGSAGAEARIEDESGQIFATAKAEYLILKRRNR